MDLWAQQHGEDGRMFQAFCAYRDTDPAVRTVRQACKDFHGDDYTKNDLGRWSSYSAKHGWVRRAQAWDNERDEQVREAELETLRAMREEQVGRSRKLQKIGSDSMDREIQKMIDDPKHYLNPALILQFVTQGASMERILRGEPSDIVRNQDADGAIRIKWGEKDAESDPSDPTDTASGSDGDNRE